MLKAIVLYIVLCSTLGFCKICQVGTRQLEVPETFDCESLNQQQSDYSILDALEASRLLSRGKRQAIFWKGFPFPPNWRHPIGRPTLPSWILRPPRPPNRPRPTPPNDIEECPDDGIKFISHPTDCEKFILCVDGEEISVLNCPGGLHFSRNTRTCINPREAECEDFEWECPDEDIPGVLVFIPNEEDCNAYYLCWQGNPIPMTCPPGQHWSIELNLCLPPNAANCIFEDAIEAFNENVKVEGIDCPALGIHQVPDPEDCETFYLCINGNAFPRTCPPDTHFSPDLSVCVPPEIANCDVSGCPADGSLAFLPNEEDCEKYYICFGGNAISVSCPSDLHWSAEKNMCMDPAEAGCEEGLMECPATGVVQIPHPDDCEQFILCLNGFEIPLNCPAGMHFCRDLRICTSPEIANCDAEEDWECPDDDDMSNISFIPNTEDCTRYYLCLGRNQIPLSCPPGTHFCIDARTCLNINDANCPWDEENEESCPDEGIKSISHPDSCEKYILCVNGFEIPRDCAPGLHFSRELRNCVHPIIANCEERFFSATSLSTTECPVITSQTEMVFQPNIHDCESYYLCTSNATVHLSCKKGMHWNAVKNTCTDKESANCVF